MIDNLYNSSSVEDILKNVLSIKKEIENHYNIKISIRDTIKQLNVEFNCSGYSITEEDFEKYLNQFEILEGNSEIDLLFRGSSKKK